MTYNRYSARA